ncbi:MAG: ABC transporter permease, partial [Desulfobacterales bacterium]|nr:ABC transporter permease [Desulfobacterales bacterium]
MRHHARRLYQSQSSYHGFLLKNINWRDLPPEAFSILANAFEGTGVVGPRVWLESEDKTTATPALLRYQARTFEALGVVGLSAKESQITGLDRILARGRWFHEHERRALLISERTAENLAIDLQRHEDVDITLWGIPFKVVGVFSGKKMKEFSDLDGEPLTPAIFPSEGSMGITEVEKEALES